MLSFFLRKLAKFKKFRNKLWFRFYKKSRTGTTEYNNSLNIVQFTRVKGDGNIFIRDNVTFGYALSPGLTTSEIYIESRHESASIIIDKNVHINNNSTIIADKSTVYIGSDSLIGPGFNCLGSNFHPINPKLRHTSNYNCKPIYIGDNVFIGANVTVLQGSKIGNNSVIGAGCTISGEIPENSIVRPNQGSIVPIRSC
ncbi:acyltransferase [Vibrio cyclitrophicus]|nr:acyltransferase [Vibrio cyclitrophicus]UPR33083.1 acyltransferase [Vibrio cyclitrophicus]